MLLFGSSGVLQDSCLCRKNTHLLPTIMLALQGVTARIRAARVGGEYRHPYDLGLCGNLHEVLGLDPSCWCIPDKTAADGSGVNFPTSWVSA